ncbi:MAG: DegV family EDD domain-containing protein [Candidatus Heimdallarchaeota archaeon]|nr:DegV family EDD domain-containing protein [Candidatus Heimdallarchaeota archaeon]MCK4255206.1 DegV family EDD domain-containing protein [Candidatus Heimdallarchaeota archaeon]
MKVKVFTDRTNFIPEELAKEYELSYVDFSILMEDGAYKENTINREDFINKMKDMDPYPTTSQPNAHDYLEPFQKTLNEGYDHIFYVAISKNLSNAQNSANIAIKKLKKGQVTIYDSEIMGPSEGIIALTASRLFKKGKSVDEVITYLDSFKDKIYGAGLSSSFDALFKTGKVKKGAAISVISSVMKLKPMFEFNFEKGLISLGGGKGFKGAVKKIMENIQEKTDPETEYVLILSDVISPDIMKTMEKEIKKIRKIKEVYYWPITVVAAHTLGKGAVTAVLGPSWEI